MEPTIDLNAPKFVRASELRPGDRFRFAGDVVTVQSVRPSLGRGWSVMTDKGSINVPIGEHVVNRSEN